MTCPNIVLAPELREEPHSVLPFPVEADVVTLEIVHVAYGSPLKGREYVVAVGGSDVLVTGRHDIILV